MTTTIGSLDINAFNDLYSDSNQYFWFESDSSATHGAGAHVTLVPDTTFISNPTGQNILMNTDGFSVRNGLLPMMTLDNDSLDFNVVDTTTGTYVTTATFSSTGSQIGQSDGSQSYMYLDYHSLQMIDKDGNTYLHISNLLDKNGLMNDVFYADGSTTKFVLAVTAANIGSAIYNVYVDDVLITSGVTKTLHDITFSVAPTNGSVVRVSYEPSNSHNINAYTLGLRKSGVAIGKLSVVEGKNNRASASNTHAEGENTSAYTDNSHAEGLNTSAGGIRTDAAAHAEGKDTSAYGTGAHAEGVNTHASGWASHAEGASTKTFNPSNGYEADYAHAEGNDSVVCSDCSHASGLGTNAYRAVQTVIGKYNEIDTYAGDPYDGTPSYDDDIVHKRYGKNVFIIGNGADDNNRSNALTVDWNGLVTASSHVQAKSSLLDRTATTAPSANTIGSGFYANDTNDAMIARFTAVHDTGNAMGAIMTGMREVNGFSKTNNFRVYLDANGDPHYAVTSPANFRSDLGIQASLSTQTITPTVSVSTGTLVYKICKRYGNVVFLSFAVRRTASTAVGGYIFEGTVSGVPLPPDWVTNGTYYGARPLMGALSSSGLFRLRNTYSQAFAMGASDSASVSFTYIV